MATNGRTQLFIRAMPPELKAALVADAREQASSVQTVAGAILAAHYGVPFEPAPSRLTTAKANTLQVPLWLPDPLALKIGDEDTRTRKGQSAIMIAILAEHYGIEYRPPRRGRKPAAA